jgi:fatty-acyl-CoA synthase
VFALLRVGAIPVVIPTRLAPGENPFKYFGVRRAFVGSDTSNTSSTEFVHRTDPNWFETLRTTQGDYRYAGPLDDVRIFSLTSGTTGQPKGVLSTQRQWLARFHSEFNTFPEVFERDVPLNLVLVGAINFSSVFRRLANQLCIGGAAILAGYPSDLDRLITDINEWGETACLLIPPLCRALMAKAPAEGVLFPEMRALLIGGAPLFPEEKREIFLSELESVFLADVGVVEAAILTMIGRRVCAETLAT